MSGTMPILMNSVAQNGLLHPFARYDIVDSNRAYKLSRYFTVYLFPTSQKIKGFHLFMSNTEPSRGPVHGELTQLRTRVKGLENQEQEWQQTEIALEESLRLAYLIREVSEALIQPLPFQESLQLCTHSLVTHLHAAFARIWMLNQRTQVLELQASAGLYTHLNGPHSRVPVGTLKIGLIAAERQPHLTNSVVGDPRVSDQEWARREGMVAFAGYPLIANDQVVGVMALFARMPLSSAVLDAMASVANAIALGIERARIEEIRDHLLQVEQQARLEAQKAHAEAESALALRNTFISTISHDLKTPLATIKGSTQLIQRRLIRGQVPETRWLLDRLNLVDSSTTRMTGMIEDLLSLAKLQSGQQPEFIPIPFDMVTVVRRVVAEQQLTTRRHRLVMEAQVSTLFLEGDISRLDRVLTNLLSNAMKYSPQGGQIRVELGQEEEEHGVWGIISVHDQGMGIPAKDLEHIFEPFYRAGNVVEDIQGTGIGLASVAQVIEQHGGTIAVTSEEGKGSTFVVRLPLSLQIEQHFAEEVQ